MSNADATDVAALYAALIEDVRNPPRGETPRSVPTKGGPKPKKTKPANKKSRGVSAVSLTPYAIHQGTVLLPETEGWIDVQQVRAEKQKLYILWDPVTLAVALIVRGDPSVHMTVWAVPFNVKFIWEPRNSDDWQPRKIQWFLTFGELAEHTTARKFSIDPTPTKANPWTWILEPEQKTEDLSGDASMHDRDTPSVLHGHDVFRAYSKLMAQKTKPRPTRGVFAFALDGEVLVYPDSNAITEQSRIILGVASEDLQPLSYII